MGKKAFIVGVNTHGLQYAKNDADLMVECLKKHNYEIIRPKNSKEKIIPLFEYMLDNAKQTDTVIMYFSGHAVIEGGELQFIIDNNSNKISNKITLNVIIKTFESCKHVNHKLVILDCCNSGTSHAKWNSDFLDKYFILTSSGRIEKTRELDELKAGFLTYHIHDALMNPTHEFLDNENKIRVIELYRWLVKQAEKHNGIENSIKVSIPNLLGNLISNFDIATVLNNRIIKKKAGHTFQTNPIDEALLIGQTKKIFRVLQFQQCVFIVIFISALTIAISMWLNIIDNHQSENNNHISTGIKLLKKGEIESADSEFDKARQVAPKSPEPLYWKARIAFARGNKGIALEYIEKGFQFNQKHTRSIVLKIKLLLLSGGELRKKASQFAKQTYGYSKVLDNWLDCLNEYDVFSQIIITDIELENKCPSDKIMMDKL